MPPIVLLIKPASSLCNLRCEYCFYHSLAAGRSTESYGLMPPDLLEVIVKKALAEADQLCTFAFQGGEPTLAGLDFYRKLLEYQRRYNYKNIPIQNALQTNGMVIDDQWARFLAQERFLVGLSLDGPKEIHDSYRIDAKNEGSFHRVMQTVQLFNRYQVEYNILFVVNNQVARQAAKTYRFFREQGFRYLQFIPCLDPLSEEPGKHFYSLTPERYAVFLKNIFDQWYSEITKGKLVSIRLFENYIGMILGHPPESCGLAGECTGYFVIEGDGGVYPCDFYVTDDWRLGNIRNQSFAELKTTDRAKAFLELSRYTDPECRECMWRRLCRGGCRRNREPFRDNRPVRNYYCSAYQEFFEYAWERLHAIARMVREGKRFH